jgi:hypothetical protein
MKKPATKEPASPGHDAWDKARGVQPKNAPKVIDRSFVSDLRGGPEIRAPHGVAVKSAEPKR